MNLDQIAKLAEIVGAVIVVITLIYLALQIRQNTQTMLSTGAQATHDALVSFYVLLATNSDLLRVFRSGAQDPATLTEDESAQYFAIWTYLMFMTQNWFYQSRTRALDEELTKTWLSAISPDFQLPGFKYYWEHRKFMFSEALRNYVEEVSAQPPTRHGYTPVGPSVE